MSLGKWVLLLLAIMIGASIVGFLAHAVKAVAGIAFVVCVVLLVIGLITNKRSA